MLPGAKRHADADLVRPARNVVRHQTEQADRCDDERENAEERVRLRERLLLQKPAFDFVGLRRHVDERQVRIDLCDGVADAAD